MILHYLFTLRRGGGGPPGICTDHLLLLPGAHSPPQYHLSTEEGWHLDCQPSGCYVSGDKAIGTFSCRHWTSYHAPRTRRGATEAGATHTQGHLGLLCPRLCGAKLGQGHSLRSLPSSGLSSGPQRCLHADEAQQLASSWTRVGLEFAKGLYPLPLWLLHALLHRLQQVLLGFQREEGWCNGPQGTAQLKNPPAWAGRPHSEALCSELGVCCARWGDVSSFFRRALLCGEHSGPLDLSLNRNSTFPQITQALSSADGTLSRFLVCWNRFFFLVFLFDHFHKMWREKRGECVGQSLKPEANEVIFDWVLKCYHVIVFCFPSPAFLLILLFLIVTKICS